MRWLSLARSTGGAAGPNRFVGHPGPRLPTANPASATPTLITLASLFFSDRNERLTSIRGDWPSENVAGHLGLGFLCRLESGLDSTPRAEAPPPHAYAEYVRPRRSKSLCLRPSPKNSLRPARSAHWVRWHLPSNDHRFGTIRRQSTGPGSERGAQRLAGARLPYRGRARRWICNRDDRGWPARPPERRVSSPTR